MQVLFLFWRGGELVRVDVQHIISAGDPYAAARTKMQRAWEGAYPTHDRCTIFLCKAGKLISAGGGQGAAGTVL